MKPRHRKNKARGSGAGVLIFAALVLGAIAIIFLYRGQPHVDVASVDAFIQRYGYFAIPALIFIGNLGAPVPEETAVLLAGFVARRGDIEYWLVVLLCIVSAIIGDSLGFLIGRKGGRPLVLRYGQRIGVTKERFDHYESFFAKYGLGTVFIARFIAGLRFMAGPLAGASRMPFHLFFLANASGAIVWVLIMTQIGYHFGPSILRLLSHVQLGLLLLIFAALAALIKRHARK